jgi:hypothetical protein
MTAIVLALCVSMHPAAADGTAHYDWSQRSAAECDYSGGACHASVEPEPGTPPAFHACLERNLERHWRSCLKGMKKSALILKCFHKEKQKWIRSVGTHDVGSYVSMLETCLYRVRHPTEVAFEECLEKHVVSGDWIEKCVPRDRREEVRACVPKREKEVIESGANFGPLDVPWECFTRFPR